MALASAESNAAPSVAKPVAARPAGKRPKKSIYYWTIQAKWNSNVDAQ
ncbi:MAG TPA: hypothetical protein PKH93_03780 [Chitinophagales bacterium]|nr:hypothetical protein [Chitinophagales bacterium]